MKHEPSFALEIIDDGLGPNVLGRGNDGSNGVVWDEVVMGQNDSLLDILVKGLKVVEFLLNVFPFYEWIGLSDILREWVRGSWRCIICREEVGGGMVVEVALEQALCLFEFQGFSSFNGRKLVHVDNGIESVVTYGIIFHSLVWRRDHDMVYKLKVVGQRVWLFGPDILKKPSEEHGLRESHFATLSHTYHSMSDIVSKIEMFANGETIEHVTQGCIGVIFVTGKTYGIFTNDDVPLLEFIS
ncbi:hypothetical protein Tco_1146466 [Tanacetum coccineum]